MNEDDFRILEMKLAIDIAKPSELVTITAKNLQWLIFQAEIVRESNISKTQQYAILLKIYGRKLYELIASLEVQP